MAHRLLERPCRQHDADEHPEAAVLEDFGVAHAQWASAFAQAGFGLGKVTGDLLGPLSFAVAMGTARVVFGARGRPSRC